MNKGKDVPAVVHRKIAILGFRAVGKSCLTNSFVSGTISREYDPTIESTHHKMIRFRKVHFATDIVDTAGMVSQGPLRDWCDRCVLFRGVVEAISSPAVTSFVFNK